MAPPFELRAPIGERAVLRSSSLTPRHRLSVGATFHSLLPPASNQDEIAARHSNGRRARCSAQFDDWLDDAQPDFSSRYHKLSEHLEERDPIAAQFLDHVIDVVLGQIGGISPTASPTARKTHQLRREAAAAAMTLALNQLLGSVGSMTINLAVIQLAFAEQIESQFGATDSLCIEINSLELPGDDDLEGASASDTVTFDRTLDTVLLRSQPPIAPKVQELPTLVEAGLRALAFSTRRGVPLPAMK